MKLTVFPESAKKSVKKNLTVRLDAETRMMLEAIAATELRTLANQITLFLRNGISDYMNEYKIKFTLSPDGKKMEIHPDE